MPEDFCARMQVRARYQKEKIKLQKALWNAVFRAVRKTCSLLHDMIASFGAQCAPSARNRAQQLVSEQRVHASLSG
jgi:hypothetical protein